MYLTLFSKNPLKSFKIGQKPLYRRHLTNFCRSHVRSYPKSTCLAFIFFFGVCVWSLGVLFSKRMDIIAEAVASSKYIVWLGPVTLN